MTSNDTQPLPLIFYDKRGVEIYRAQPRQAYFHGVRDAVKNRLYGGAAGGGKTEAILWEAYFLSTLKDPRFHGMRGAIFRKTFPEIDEFFIKRALAKFPRGTYTYTQSKHEIRFHETGSTIKFCYCENELDVVRYQGAEWDWLAIDELTHHSEYVVKYLMGRMRTNKPGWKCLFFAGTNPGGLGHSWVKRIFIDKELTDAEKKVTWYFVPARLEDNPKMLENNPDYEDQLMLLPDPMMRNALRYGSWNIFAGQFFTELRPDVHGFEPFEIPREWVRFLEIDYGYDHPAVCHWNAIDNDGEIWKYREYVCRNKTYAQFAEEILTMTGDDEMIEYGVADPAIWAKKGSGDGLSGAEEMQNVFDADKFYRGIVIAPANNERVLGWGIMREWLKITDRQGKPHVRLHISNELQWWWKKVPELQRDPRKPEDVLKATVVNADGSIGYSDDSGDATRYGLMSRPRPGTKKIPDKKVDRYGQPIKKASFGIAQGKSEWENNNPQNRRRRLMESRGQRTNSSPSLPRPQWNPIGGIPKWNPPQKPVNE